MNNIQEQYQDDEIDLRELIISLWGNRLLILTITLIFGITGIVYAFLAPQVWRAKAIVVAPLPAQLGQLQLRLENFVALRDIATNNHTDALSVFFEPKLFTDFLAAFSEPKLFTDFIQAFDSFDNKSEFLKTNGYVRQEDTDDGSTLRHSLEKRAENISVNQKKDEPFATLSFRAENAQEAGKLLNEYLRFIQTKEVETKNKLLADKITNQTNTLTLTYQVQEKETLKRLQEDIALTEFSLRISRSADIEAPLENLNNQSIFAIDLGAKALNEKLKILKEIKSPELINRTLADIRLQMDSLQAIPQEKVSFTSHYFLQSPYEPLSRDKPNRFLVVISATLSGLVLGVMVAFFRASWLLRYEKRG